MRTKAYEAIIRKALNLIHRLVALASMKKDSRIPIESGRITIVHTDHYRQLVVPLVFLAMIVGYIVDLRIGLGILVLAMGLQSIVLYCRCLEFLRSHRRTNHKT